VPLCSVPWLSQTCPIYLLPLVPSTVHMQFCTIVGGCNSSSLLGSVKLLPVVPWNGHTVPLLPALPCFLTLSTFLCYLWTYASVKPSLRCSLLFTCPIHIAVLASQTPSRVVPRSDRILPAYTLGLLVRVGRFFLLLDLPLRACGCLSALCIAFFFCCTTCYLFPSCPMFFHMPTFLYLPNTMYILGDCVDCSVRKDTRGFSGYMT
jgi:hypothetical protein